MKEANGRATSVLARRPHGAIQDSDFKFVETDVPAPGAGEVLVRNLMLSSDPAQRAWIALKPRSRRMPIGQVTERLERVA